MELNLEKLGTYLTDHLAGAAAGRDLVEQISSATEDPEMAVLLREIEQDRDTLERYVDGLGIRSNPLKEAAGAIAERLCR